MEEYFTETAIITLLIRYRLQLAAKRRRNFVLSKKNPSLFYSVLNSNPIFRIDKLFPPRREWKRFSRKRRKGLNESQAKLFSLQVTIDAARNANADWYKNLISFVNLGRNTALYDTQYKIHSPISYFLKDRKRIISSYETKDRIILEILTRYFMDIFASCLKFYHYAPAHGKIGLSHKEIINNIVQFAYSASTKKLYIAHVDIYRFSDLLDHEVVKILFKEFVAKASTHEKHIDARAIELFFHYLDTYNTHDALAQLQADPKDKELLKLKFTDLKQNLEEVGLPGGSSLTLFICNLLLEELDSEIVSEKGYKIDFSYARYIDDIVIISKSQTQCKYIFDKVQTALTNLKCIIHKYPNKITYDDSYSHLKSKPVHCWKEDYLNEENSTPVLNFLGCTIPFPKKSNIETIQAVNSLF